MNIAQIDIQKLLPQKYPFCFIDRVVEFEKGKRLVAVKNITANEWACSSLDRSPVPQCPSAPACASRFTFHASPSAFPPTLLIESAAQAALLLYQLSMVKEGEHPTYVLGKVKAEFSGEAKVGDEVVFSVANARMLTSGGYAEVEAAVGGANIAKVTAFFGIQNKTIDHGL